MSLSCFAAKNGLTFSPSCAMGSKGRCWGRSFRRMSIAT
jgi:hypothetical protein